MYRHILIPLDCTAADEAILQHIRPLARLTGARLTLIHVADGFMARNQERLAASPEMQADADYLARRCAELAADGLNVDSVLACGEPGVEILAAVEREACDLIAMATHGHRGLADLILGSTANVVRHRTEVPILMVRASRQPG